MARVAAGDAQAFTELFRRRRGDVYRFALHMTASPDVAEDVTQEVFMVVMKDATRYEAGRSGVPAWLCGIARNFVRRRLERERALQPLVDDDNGAEQALSAVAEHPLDELTRAEEIDALRRAILSLPLRYRDVVVVCELQEMSYAEAAEALGCAVGTVRSRLHRGRALLAAKMRSSSCESRSGQSLSSNRSPVVRCIA